MARGSFAAWLKELGLAVLQILLFAVVTLVVSVLVLLPFGIEAAQPADEWPRLIDLTAPLAGALLATWLVGIKLLRRSWADLGWRRPAGRHVLRGVVIGALMATLAIGLALAGGARIGHDGLVRSWPMVAGPLLVGLLAAALFEELVFRGLPLRRVADALGPWVATALVSLAFAAAHLANPSVSLFGIVNIALAGVWLSVAFFSPGGMSLAWGLHFGWNAMIGVGFDAPVSGLVLHVPGPEYTVGRWAWLDGGAFGPEGGVVATIAMTAGTAYLLHDRRRPAPVEAAA